MRMAIAAPKAAPCEAPSKSWETRGFWNVPWNAAPALARQQPIKRASTMRGRRTLKKMEACWLVHVGSMRSGATWFTSMASASAGLMGKRPKSSDTAASTTTSAAMTAMTRFSRPSDQRIRLQSLLHDIGTLPWWCFGP